ncbi:hypothetical protein [Microbacterium sp. Root180]|uniref:hypothetical protein n=1 Tax=Microbacterium sp. Root180 TaxID=1736483 RepID=UPI0006F507B4|nr:hypothetical protein [Microbacterium sp. Root180]KRB38983.1 hypothetical protein ASD93_03360 [Microbacterium sp. Root180]
MDNMGETFLAAFFEGASYALRSFWEAMLANPWLFLIVVVLVVLAVANQLTPRRRRRGAR